jgi:hypothetical protein
MRLIVFEFCETEPFRGPLVHRFVRVPRFVQVSSERLLPSRVSPAYPFTLHLFFTCMVYAALIPSRFPLRNVMIALLVVSFPMMCLFVRVTVC